MKNERKTEIKVGITVTLSLLLFIWIFGWAKNFTLSSDRKIVKIEFVNTAGLEVGDQVTINGVRKGFVGSVNNIEQKVLVSLSLDKDSELYSDAIFGIIMLDLMGGKKVEIKPGKSNQKLDYTKTHDGIFYADIPEMVSMLGSLDDQLPEIMNEIKISLNSLNSYLTDQKMSSEIKSTISNLSDISILMKRLIDDNKRNFDLIAKNSAEITTDAKELIKTNKESVNSSVEKLNLVLIKTDSLLTSLNYLISETQNKQNNAGKILYDENLIKDLNITLKNIKELTDIALDQMQKNGLKVETKIKLF
jgi:phospholipid/cholesterol/gamma-HCH transport system substrate-binding protein